VTATRDERPVRVAAGPVELEGTLCVPPGARGVVVFAHGSGSSRHSRRNRYVAETLQRGGLATLLFDLLSEEEERVDQVTRHLRFDVPMLAQRVDETTRWLRAEPGTQRLVVGYFGSSTGAAAALIAAVGQPDVVRAVVSRGGRPDLAIDVLPEVRAATLLVVGGDDTPVIEMNRRAYDALTCEKRLEVVPGATHLFEEPGKLEHVAGLARDWFREHLGAAPEPAPRGGDR
jgi:putative phosphoribosyl transferase